MKLSPAVDLLWRVAVREAVAGRSECVEPEHFLMSLTTGRDFAAPSGFPFQPGCGNSSLRHECRVG